ncbi:AbrB/MazE/SpoVT family DNA-binding domain-containing protein [Roseiarcaceae bacterium H3SJ34-1]|uniref:AbrB/MazE/SpoVT family DNA-binding domain-containing protein n=1 Tax=Terripilifer ovatus TaxID=3032367 RepID=UPI003AB973ED|nr:AbrB/MazE/SpoVT family DNA-binding domain-containing protein [Roseiarcaceae bacterium H3SJ34-1]
MRITKWGNSLAVRLPRAMVKTLHLKEGDDIKISVTRRHSLEMAEAPEALVKRLRKYRGRLPEGFNFARPETNQRLTLKSEPRSSD